MSDEIRPSTGSGGQPDAYYQSLSDAQLLSIYESSEVNSAEYTAVMNELHSRGYSFNDPDPAPPMQQPQAPGYQQPAPAYQQQMPPYSQYQQGAPHAPYKPEFEAPYGGGATVAWQVVFFLMAVGVVILMLTFMDEYGMMNGLTKILTSVVTGMIIMSTGFIFSGVRHLANKKNGYDTCSVPAAYWIFGGFWILVCAYLWITSIISFIRVAEFNIGLAFLQLLIAGALSLFPLVQFMIFKLLAKQLSQ
jgi:hypothetical protein